jgi:sec-independent protein translocase protein TatB
MFDFGIGYTEIFLVAVVAVIVIGPKDLPKVLRAFGRTVAKMRGMAREFQGHLDQAMKESGMDEVKKEVSNLKNTVASAADPVKTIKSDVESSLKKQDDDFKKYFGEIDNQVKAPEKPADPAPAAAPALSAGDTTKPAA